MAKIFVSAWILYREVVLPVLWFLKTLFNQNQWIVALKLNSCVVNSRDTNYDIYNNNNDC